MLEVFCANDNVTKIRNNAKDEGVVSVQLALTSSYRYN